MELGDDGECKERLISFPLTPSRFPSGNSHKRSVAHAERPSAAVPHPGMGACRTAWVFSGPASLLSYPCSCAWLRLR